MEELQIIVFKVGEEFYGIDIKTVSGIETVKGFTKVPNTASYIKGIISLRGSIVPVYSLRKKFGLEDLEREELNLVIARLGDVEMAIEIDKIDVIQNVEPSMIHGVPSIVKTPGEQYYDKVISVDDRIIVVISAEKLVSDADKEMLDKLLSDKED